MTSIINEKQMTLPVECPECQCGTVLNCACDWKMNPPKSEFSKMLDEYLIPKLAEETERIIIMNTPNR